MAKNLLSCFGFIVALIVVAAVTSITAQPSQDVVEMQFNQAAEARLQQIEGDIAFIIRALQKIGAIEER